MSIPALDEHGFLPPGVHLCALSEVREQFGRFRGSDHRVRLFQKLETFLSEANSARLLRAVVVNGSFVTGKPLPNDIDLLLVLPAGHDFKADLGPAQYNLVDRPRVKQVYGFDVFVGKTAHPTMISSSASQPSPLAT